MAGTITGYTTYALGIWYSFALGDIISLVLGLAAILVLTSILVRTKDGFHKSLRYFLYAFVAYAVTKIIRMLGLALGVIDNWQIKVLITLFNFIFVVLILIGLTRLLKIIKYLCNTKVGKKAKKK